MDVKNVLAVSLFPTFFFNNMLCRSTFFRPPQSSLLVFVLESTVVYAKLVVFSIGSERLLPPALTNVYFNIHLIILHHSLYHHCIRRLKHVILI